MDYYVYHHVDPRNNKAVYVGLGKYDRAWCIRKNQRSLDHVQWVEEMFSLGYTLNDIVFIPENRITKQQAAYKEKQYIKTLEPVFNKSLNKKHWSKHRNFDVKFCQEIKALREMGYTFRNIAFLSGSEKPVVNAMSMKRMSEYV